MGNESIRRPADLIRSYVYGTRGATGSPRSFALLTGVVLIGSFLSVLFDVTAVVGGSTWLAGVVGGAIIMGVVAARVPLPIGLAITALLFGSGLGGYLLAIPDLYGALSSLRLLRDFVALLLGDMALLQIYRADLWAVLMAPAPVYGTWYLLLRRRYSLAAWIGGATLLFFVLTGDASDSVALLGAASALGVLGFGTLDYSEANWRQIREMGLLLAGVLVFTRLSRPVASRITRSTAAPGVENSMEATTSPTIESSLIETAGEINIHGSISLSPVRRFTVTAEEPSYWLAGAYDRYTGDGWVRSGTVEAYTEPMSGPPGETQAFDQRFEVESTVQTMPAAWQPVRVGDGVAPLTQVTDLGTFQTSRPFTAGETYSVTSQRPTWTAESLRVADDEFPESIRRRYLQLPNGTPERIRRFATDITGDAESRYERTVRVKDWLAAEKDYSLKVTRPDSAVADSFIFDMERGYCVYFATAMVVMLRSLEIPARFVVGYTTGQSVADGQWEIRGLNSHAWVQVYFPNVGWVRFDPTPSDPREIARARRLRETGQLHDDDLVPGASDTPTPETPPSQENTSSLPAGDTRALQRATDPDDTPTDVTAPRPGERGVAGQNREGSSGFTRRALFTNLSGSDQLAILGGFIGVVLGITGLELPARVYRFVSIQWQQPTDSPERDIERAIDRVEWVLAHTHRERQPGETRRAHFESIGALEDSDQRVRTFLQRYELARYDGQASRETADQLMAEVDDYIRDHATIGLITGYVHRSTAGGKIPERK